MSWSRNVVTLLSTEMFSYYHSLTLSYIPSPDIVLYKRKPPMPNAMPAIRLLCFGVSHEMLIYRKYSVRRFVVGGT